MRTPNRWTLAIAPIVLAVAACGPIVPGSSGGAGGDRIHQQAQAALASWAGAVHEAKQGLVFVGELTSQVGDWEEPVGANNKIALMSGAVRAAASLSTATPPPGEVRWADGTSTPARLLSPAQALDEVAKSGDSMCSDCRPLEITAARLTTGTVQMSRGPATVPVWEFTVKGTRVKVTRVAVADRVSVVPLPWDPNNAPDGISIESARGTADARQITVTFVGAPGRGDEPCGSDYTAEAVESDLAIVVIVVEHRNPTPGACSLVGAMRTAVVDLASPLGDRTVLEIKQGLPVAVLQP